jgi:hypothetical protein
MNREKMHKLALFLEDLESSRFNIGYWVSQSLSYDDDESLSYGDEIEFTDGEVLDVNLCGTAGCIAGWAVALENNGRIAVMEGYDDDDEYKWHNFCGHCYEKHFDTQCPKGYVTIDIAYVETVARNILGLTTEEARRLFIPDQNSIWEEHAADYDLNNNGFTNFYPDVHPKHAADMIYRILKGEVKL